VRTIENALENIRIANDAESLEASVADGPRVGERASPARLSGTVERGPGRQTGRRTSPNESVTRPVPVRRKRSDSTRESA
jgi:hypothetical protein